MATSNLPPARPTFGDVALGWIYSVMSRADHRPYGSHSPRQRKTAVTAAAFQDRGSDNFQSLPDGDLPPASGPAAFFSLPYFSVAAVKIDRLRFDYSGDRTPPLALSTPGN